MYKDCALLTYYALTPLHMGAGSSVSYVDLPIQRERHTSFPIMAGSGIKGVFRSYAQRKVDNNNNRIISDAEVNTIFGPEDGSQGSSLISFTDARILLYPVRSIKGVFAWITCPMVLKRFNEDLKITGKQINNFNIPSIDDDTKIIIANESKLKIDYKNKVGLEEFVFDIQADNNVGYIINGIKNYLPSTDTTNTLADRFAIVSDNVFMDLVNYAVEVRTRIKIDQTTGTAQSGALFTLEMVPSEAIFYNLVLMDKKGDLDVKDKMSELFANNETVLQFGGDETIGLGFVKVKFNNSQT